MSVGWSTTNKNARPSLSNSNLTVTGSGTNLAQGGRADTAITGSDLVVWEEIVTANPSVVGVGFGNASTNLADNAFLGDDTNSVGYYSNGSIYYNNSVLATVDTWTTSDVVMWAINKSAGHFWVRVGTGDWNGDPSANPATNTNGIAVSVSGDLFPAYSAYNATVETAHFLASSFVHTPPSGFTAYDSGSASLAAPAIVSVFNGATSIADNGSTTSAALTVHVTLDVDAAAGDVLRLFDGGTQTGSDYTLTGTDISNGTAVATTGTLT